jgi:hypothetical protein
VIFFVFFVFNLFFAILCFSSYHITVLTKDTNNANKKGLRLCIRFILCILFDGGVFI